MIHLSPLRSNFYELKYCLMLKMTLISNTFYYKLFYYCEEMLYSGKQKQKIGRLASSTSHLDKTSKLTFRTILKRRNDTISTSQLYEQTPQSNQMIRSNHLSHSQIAFNSQEQQESQPQVNIKDFAKTIGNRKCEKKDFQSLVSKDPKRKDDDCLSQKSSRSVLSNSNFFKKESLIERKEEKRTFEDLQKRVESMLLQNFQQIRKQKSGIGISNWAKNQSSLYQSKQKEISIVYTWLKQLEQKQQVCPDKLEDLNKKILLIQKLIARQCVSSDFFKDLYFNWTSQRGNTTSFIKKSILKESMRYNEPQLHGKIHKQAEKSKQVVSKYDSTSTASYKKPAKQYYLVSKQKKNSYSVNRQPIPRSSYSAQYLNYGYIPPYHCKTQQGKRYPDTSLAIKASTYQQQYKSKLGLTKGIDFKELDCFKDKFKNTNISFMDSSKKCTTSMVDLHKKNLNQAKKENKDSNVPTIPQESLLNCMNMTNSSIILRSQHQKQFLWHNTMNTDETEVEGFLKSQIKGKRLERLKQSFRALAARR